MTFRTHCMLSTWAGPCLIALGCAAPPPATTPPNPGESAAPIASPVPGSTGAAQLDSQGSPQPSAQTDKPSPGRSLSEAWKLALTHNPELLAMAADVRVARGARAEETALANPSLRLTRLRPEEFEAGSPSPSLALRTPVPNPFTLTATSESFRISEEQKLILLEAKKRALLLELTLAYTRLAILVEERKLLLALIAVDQAQAEHVKAALGGGQVTRLNQLLLEGQAAERQALLQENDARRTETELLVQLLCGTAGEQVRPELSPALISKVPPPSGGAAAEVSHSRLAAGLGRKHAEAEVKAARRAAYPWFDWVEVGYRFGPDDVVSFGMSVEIPILSQGGGAIEKAEATLEKAAQEERQVSEQEVARSRLAALHTSERYSRLSQIEEKEIPLLEGAVAEAQQSVSAGALPKERAFDLERALLEKRREGLRVLGEYRAALAELLLPDPS